MPQRVYVKGKKTHATGETFSQDNAGAEKERFQVSLDLMSLKTIKDYDALGTVAEFYFKVDGDKLFKARWPNKGVIKLKKNQEFVSKADMSIWSEFKTVRVGKEKIVNLTVELREQDHLKKDQIVAKQDLQIKLPAVTDYIIVQDEKELTKAKLRIQSTKTRY